MSLKLKRVIIVRNGHDQAEGDLSPEGVAQAERIANALQAICIDGAPSALLTSPAARAVETADIIAKKVLLADYTEESRLWRRPENGKADCREAVRLVREKGLFGGFDILVLVTHQPQCSMLPHLIASDLLGLEHTAWGGDLRHGEAWDINVEQKTCTKLEIPA